MELMEHQKEVVTRLHNGLEEEIVEEWREIEGFPNHQVSNLGNVRNWKSGIVLSTAPSGWGYCHVMLWKDGKAHTKYNHVMAAKAFVEGYHDGLEANHKDGDKSNNNVENLEWVTKGQNNQHALDSGLRNSRGTKVQIIETGEIFPTVKECAEHIDGLPTGISAVLNGRFPHYKGYTFRYVENSLIEEKLMPHQLKALELLGNGKVLHGGVGTGKSLVAIAYYMKVEAPKNILVVTTAKKRDSLDWMRDFASVGIGTTKDTTIGGVLTVDSFNNIEKYIDLEDYFVVFDEQRLVGHGAWVKAFIKIAKKNRWVMLTATPGDTWIDYIPVFIANNLYKNAAEFTRDHIIYAPFVRFPKIVRYVDVYTLEKYRNMLLVEMPYLMHTTRIIKEIEVEYDEVTFRKAVKDRWNPYTNKPVRDVAELFRVMRRIVNSDASRLRVVKTLLEEHNRLIVFYNYDYELEILRSLGGFGVEVAEWNGHKHQPIPLSEKWVYLVQYVAGAESWNCIETDAMCFWSLTYSWKNFHQAMGRIDRLNTPFTELYYYILMSKSIVDLAVRRSLKGKKLFNERRWSVENLR